VSLSLNKRTGGCDPPVCGTTNLLGVLNTHNDVLLFTWVSKRIHTVLTFCHSVAQVAVFRYSFRYAFQLFSVIFEQTMFARSGD